MSLLEKKNPTIDIIENEDLRIEISSLGAEIQSLKLKVSSFDFNREDEESKKFRGAKRFEESKGFEESKESKGFEESNESKVSEGYKGAEDFVEYLWQGDPASWKGRAPVLFPICGRLEDGMYMHKRQAYKIPIHGFARDSVFKLKERQADRIVYLLESGDETYEIYPFDFALEIAYSLQGRRLDISYRVINKSGEEIYFSIGSHEGYFCPEGVESCILEFEEAEDFKTSLLDGFLLTDKLEKLHESGKLLPIKKSFFDNDTVIFKNIASKSLVLNMSVDKENIRQNDIKIDGNEWNLQARNLGAYADGYEKTVQDVGMNNEKDVKKDAKIYGNVDINNYDDQGAKKALRRVRITYEDFPNLLIWAKPEANFICIEPWAGLPHTVGWNQELKDKEGIMALPPGLEKSLVHSIEVLP